MTSFRIDRVIHVSWETVPNWRGKTQSACLKKRVKKKNQSAKPEGRLTSKVGNKRPC